MAGTQRTGCRLPFTNLTEEDEGEEEEEKGKRWHTPPLPGPYIQFKDNRIGAYSSHRQEHGNWGSVKPEGGGNATLWIAAALY